MNQNTWNDFSLIFLSTFVEAIPFLLIGAFVASLLELYVSENTIRKILPKNIFLQIFAISFTGFIFPVCECAIIPITRKLIQKQVPVPVALTFMMTVPIINPISLAATYFAFPQHPQIVIYRIIFGLAVSWLGSIFYLTTKSGAILAPTFVPCGCTTHEAGHATSCTHDHKQHLPKQTSALNRFLSLIRHTKNEFFDVGVYLIFGSAISAFIQVILPDSALSIIQKHESISLVSLQLLGYILSLCSHADAFVAAGFINHFSIYAIMGFLITSPLLDIKNTIVLYGSFQKKFTNLFILRIFILIFIVITIYYYTGKYLPGFSL